MPRLLVAVLLASLAVAVPAQARVLNIAHQGGEDESPSNTMYAYKRALAAGADMLELDVGVSRDGHVVVMHDTTVERTTNGRGLVSAKTLRRLKRLDAAHDFKGGRFRGVATGRRAAPRGFKAADFRVPTLREVLRAFPRTPMTIEIKGRTKDEAPAEYVRNAEALARLLKGTRRRDLIVASFQQRAVDRFHALVPQVGVAPGIDGAARYLLSNQSPGDGVVALQLPITYRLGAQTLDVTTRDNVARAHRDGFEWHVWLSDDGESPAVWRRLIDWCVDGVMTARPRAFERVAREHDPPAAC